MRYNNTNIKLRKIYWRNVKKYEFRFSKMDREKCINYKDNNTDKYYLEVEKIL